MADALADVPYLLGSVHTFTPGYGYGARVPTVRNQPTLPASKPLYRYPPLTERQQNMCKTVQLDMTGSKAVQRHKDQMAMQTSGDYGRFMFQNNPESSSSRRTPSSRPHTTATIVNPRSSSQEPVQPRLGNAPVPVPVPVVRSADNATENLVSPIRTSNSGTSRASTGTSIRSDYGSICKYRKKDPLQDTMPRYSKYDLLASKAPPRDKSEVSWCAIGNHMASEQSHSWALGLRPYKRPSTGTGSDAGSGGVNSPLNSSGNSNGLTGLKGKL